MLEVRHIHKQLSGQIVLKNLDLKVRESEFLSLLGPSGCGKTTLLRILAGIETPDSGQVIFRGQDITNFKPQQRPFHMIFQKYALFPHLTVAENIAFGLKIKKKSSREINEAVAEVLSLTNLVGLENRYPESLSGGQSQRVAVARALVNKPQVLLLDEPFSALDQKMRTHMQLEMKSLQKKLGITFIFVTHDQDEAFYLSDRIAILNQGHLEEFCEPINLYRAQRNQFVSEFIGDASQVQGVVEKIAADKIYFRLPNGELISGFALGKKEFQVGEKAMALIRSDKVGFTAVTSLGS